MALNESPSEKEGKFFTRVGLIRLIPLNESPSEKEGKCQLTIQGKIHPKPSMKVPPKRKGNPTSDGFLYTAPGSPQ